MPWFQKKTAYAPRAPSPADDHLQLLELDVSYNSESFQGDNYSTSSVASGSTGDVAPTFPELWTRTYSNSSTNSPRTQVKRGSRFGLIRMDSSASFSSVGSSNASSRAGSSCSRTSSADSSISLAASTALNAAGGAATAVASKVRKYASKIVHTSRGYTEAENWDDGNVAEEYGFEPTVRERVRRHVLPIGRTKEYGLRDLSEDGDRQCDLPADVWSVVLSHAECSDIGHFGCCSCDFLHAAYGYAGADFKQPGWFRERRVAVQDRWSRARAVLTQVHVVRGMRVNTPSARRCPQLQRLNRHRR